jgi:hypothetical protein
VFVQRCTVCASSPHPHQAKPGKIVAGLEPEGTNMLLQMLALATQRCVAVALSLRHVFFPRPIPPFLPPFLLPPSSLALSSALRCAVGDVLVCVCPNCGSGDSSNAVRRVLAGEQQPGEGGAEAGPEPAAPSGPTNEQLAAAMRRDAD